MRAEMTESLELLLGRAGERPALLSPEVGFFSCALPRGALLTPRAPAGVLHSLGRRFDLVVPSGVSGRVVSERPERVLAPVGYGSVLYELEPLGTGASDGAESSQARAPSAGALLLRAPYSGRFWQRPSPNDPPFVKEGDTLSDGKTLGMIEVMKTFTQLVYRSGGELPPRARLRRFLVADGGEIEDGGALLELEPA
jgi:acetyl-CoA carboxylase biotin carboxyl carrier protein